MRDRWGLAERLMAGDFLALPVIDGHSYLMTEAICTDLVANLEEPMQACRGMAG